MGGEPTRPAAPRRGRLMEWLYAAAVHPVTLIAVGSAAGGNLRDDPPDATTDLHVP